MENFGISSIDLLTNNPDKIESIEKCGITVDKRVPLEVETNSFNIRYLKTKKEKMNHILSI